MSLLALCSFSATAQNYPSRTIRLIVPFSPGGGTDFFARVVAGKLTQVSADVLMDPKTNLPFFKASIDVTPEGMVKLKKNEIRAGMPAEIFVRSGERTAMNYLLKPLLDRVRRSMTEP